VGVQIGNIGDIVTVLFQPVSKRELPKQPLSRSRGERGVNNLTILPIRTLKAHLNSPAPVPMVGTVVVKRKLSRPAVIGLPCKITALKNQTGFASIPDHKHNITLRPVISRA
jgi:hypothetical protein